MTPAGGLESPVKLTTRATIEPSPDSGCHTKLNSSALENTPCPDPLTVNTPFVYVALPVSPTAPTSKSIHEPRSCVATEKAKGLLSFMLGATDTTKFPDIAPDGIVIAIEVLLQL